MIEVIGKGGISATVVADSVSSVTGKRITTFELEYPRFIHSEFMTHRLFSRNAASSRAIPVEKLLKLVKENPAKPIHWGRNMPGMQAKEELSGSDLDWAQWAWKEAANSASELAEVMNGVKAHKQIVNRILEPFQFIKVVCTATEFDNFFWLRDHGDAQPEISEPARCMKEALDQSNPKLLASGDWHVPYYEGNYGSGVWKDSGYAQFRDDDDFVGFVATDCKKGGHTLEEALKISASCCAQVSYRAIDNSLEKAEKIYKALVESVPVHASPFEHAATPMKAANGLAYMLSHQTPEKGVTHMNLTKEAGDCDLWSGNFCGWIQYRQLLDNNTKWGEMN